MQLVIIGVNTCPLFCQQNGIEYDHFWQGNIIENKIKITVKGFVPFELVENHIVLSKCPRKEVGKDYLENMASIFKGEATVFARGELLIVDEDAPEEFCRLSFEHSIKVTLRGKNWWKPNHLGWADLTYNFELDEDWTKLVKWKVQCNDPEQAAMLRMLLPKRLHMEVYSGGDKTLQFPNFDGSVLEDVAFYGMLPGMTGKLRYIFHSAAQKGADWNPKGSQLRFDDSKPKPKDYPKPKGEWGPPLSKIVWKRPGE